MTNKLFSLLSQRLTKQAFNIRVTQIMKEKAKHLASREARHSRELEEKLKKIQNRYLNTGTILGGGVGGVGGAINEINNIKIDPETGEPVESKLRAGLRGGLTVGAAGAFLGRMGGKGAHFFKEPKIYDKHLNEEIARHAPIKMDAVKEVELKRRLERRSQRDADKAMNMFLKAVDKNPSNPEIESMAQDMHKRMHTVGMDHLFKAQSALEALHKKTMADSEQKKELIKNIRMAIRKDRSDAKEMLRTAKGYRDQLLGGV